MTANKSLLAFAVIAFASFALTASPVSANGDWHDKPKPPKEEECAECGNGKVEKGEQCDDGNRNDNDECSNKCQKQIIKEVEKEVIKEVPVEVIKEVEKVVYKDKDDDDDDDDDDKKKKKKKKVVQALPATGLPLAGVAGLTLLSTGAYLATKRYRAK